MTSILFSITSHDVKHYPFVKRIVDSYTGDDFAGYNVHIALACNYTSSFSASKVTAPSFTMLPNIKCGWDYTWNNESYLEQNYTNYDLIVSQDDDVLITPTNIEYYLQYQGLPLTYIPGYLVGEYTHHGTASLLTQCSIFGQTVIDQETISGSSFFTPRSCHSACFIADKDRYAQFLKASPVVPETYSFYTHPMLSRSAIYLFGQMKKIVGLKNVRDGSAIINHLPCRYSKGRTVVKFPTQIQFSLTGH